jgi:O-succinylbenzoate synthase
MRLQSIDFFPIEIPLETIQKRKALLLCIQSDDGKKGWGEIAPLEPLNLESLQEAEEQVLSLKEKLLSLTFEKESLLHQLSSLSLLPSVSFALESCLLSLLLPLPKSFVATSALAMGSLQQILSQARQRKLEGFTSLKVKVSSLSKQEAFEALSLLKDEFSLRVDVNRAWETKEALDFFSSFPISSFDYVEEPFQNPLDLALFPHPLAVDESFLDPLSLSDLEKLPTLKALIYKPTVQGGWSCCLPLVRWTKSRGISLVLSSSFESDLGLYQIAALSQRLSLKEPIGIGTYHYLTKYVLEKGLPFFDSFVHVLPLQEALTQEGL